MTDPGWIAWTVVIPLLGAMAAYASGRRAGAVAVAVALATLCAATGVVWQVALAGPFTHTVGGWTPPLGIALRADGIAAILLAVFTVVAVAVTAHAWLHLDLAAPSSRSFFSLWCVTWGALNALLLSSDVFNMYVALELTTLAAVALLANGGGRAAWAAALHYLLFAMAGSLAYLAGVVVLYGSQSSLDTELLGASLTAGPAAYAALSLMMVGLALKSALFPFHAWLPPAYASASAPVAVILAALVSKSAFYVLLRVWIDVFPALAPVTAARWLGALGAVGIVWGSVLAVRQRRLAMLLAWSSVAQIGFFFLFFPLGTPAALQGSILLLASHALAKGALFMAVGNIRRAAGDDDLGRMQGLAGRLPLTFWAMALAGTSLIGMPPTGGFIGKWLLARTALETGAWWWAVVALGGGLLTAVYVFRMLRGAFLPEPEGVTLTVPPRVDGLVPLILALLAVGLGVAPWLPLSLMAARSGP